jgi:thiamine transport system ATP-binding protein
MTELHLDEVSKQYDDVTALKAVDLDIRDGEFFTLVGPSGCGKTTTLRLVAGFEQPTDGTIRFGEEDVSDVPPEERDVGIVFQHYALFPHMTVRENVGYGLRFREPPGDQTKGERVADLLELVDLPGMGDRRPDALSGGQQQRVALARALAPGPDVLLLDEPMSALDARLRESLRVEVKRIQSELGITTLYVTHDQAEALAVSDRVAVMRAGGVEQVGTPEGVYRRPATRFVAEFVGDNNVFDAPAVVRDGAFVADVGGRSFRLPGDARAETPSGVGSALGAAADGDADSVAFAVRPEALRVGGGTNEFTVSVESVEFLGDAYRVHCRWDGREVVVKTEEAVSGDVRLGFEPGDAWVLGR